MNSPSLFTLKTLFKVSGVQSWMSVRSWEESYLFSLWISNSFFLKLFKFLISLFFNYASSSLIMLLLNTHVFSIFLCLFLSVQKLIIIVAPKFKYCRVSSFKSVHIKQLRDVNTEHKSSVEELTVTTLTMQPNNRKHRVEPLWRLKLFKVYY